ARLMSQGLPKPTASIMRANRLVSLINRTRKKNGVLFGSPRPTSGGTAPKFYASVRLDIRRLGSVKEGEEVVGNETRVKVVKNKMAPPFRQCEFQILDGKGINRLGEVVDMGVRERLIDKSGARHSYKGDKIGQGKANVVKFLEENTAVAAEIEGLLREKYLSGGAPPPRAKESAGLVEESVD